MGLSLPIILKSAMRMIANKLSLKELFLVTFPFWILFEVSTLFRFNPIPIRAITIRASFGKPHSSACPFVFAPSAIQYP
jgi:hypothetical protein